MTLLGRITHFLVAFLLVAIVGSCFSCSYFLGSRLPGTGGAESVWQEVAEDGYWGKTPLKVGLDPSLRPSVISVLDTAMRQFPCGMFVFAEEGEEPDVRIWVNDMERRACGEVVDAETGDEGDWAGLTYLCGETRRADIVLRSTSEKYNITETYLLLYHELGHAAGLEHDQPYYEGYEGDFVSVMTPDVMKYAGRLELGLLLPVLSSRDTKALEGRFCRE